MNYPELVDLHYQQAPTCPGAYLKRPALHMTGKGWACSYPDCDWEVNDADDSGGPGAEAGAGENPSLRG